VLAEGGNAVDACIAAGFTSWVTESPLTGPGSGGFMLVHRAGSTAPRVLDFFVTAPGKDHPAQAAAMEAVSVEFTSESSQVFRVGAASCAVPGSVAGLAEVHRTHGTRPWETLVEPAVALARGGVKLTRPQAHLHAILDLILRRTEEGRAIYGRDGRLAAGEPVVMKDLALTLEAIAERGASAFYEGAIAQAMAAHVNEQGGTLTTRDLADYRPVWRRPVRAVFQEHEFVANPPPSSGGVLVGYALRLLDRVGVGGPPGSADATAALVEVMREQSRARDGRFGRELHRGGLAKRLLADETIREAAARVRRRERGLAEASGSPGTTHISVVDGDGNAASLTASTGSGSGVIVPGTGVHLNNMLGEFDLHVSDGAIRPGRRLNSMMAPSVVLRGREPRLVLGSAGSLRLRGAILQIVVNVVAHGMSVDDAVAAPRIHLEEPSVHCEGGADAAELDRLSGWGYEVVRWRRRNLYFGGAAGVELRPDGRLAAAGDPRRGGHGIVVE